MMQQHTSGTPTAPTCPPEDERKPYGKPAILHELELETRAGTPEVDMPDLLNPLGLPGGEG